MSEMTVIVDKRGALIPVPLEEIKKARQEVADSFREHRERLLNAYREFAILSVYCVRGASEVSLMGIIAISDMSGKISETIELGERHYSIRHENWIEEYMQAEAILLEAARWVFRDMDVRIGELPTQTRLTSSALKPADS